MPFWSDANISPKLAFRWFASFGVGENAVSTYSLRSFQKPSFEIAVSEYIWLNDVSYRPGLLSWNPLEIIVTDIENTSENNAKKIYNMLTMAGYQSTDVNKPRSAIEKRRASISLGGQVSLTQIDADANAIEEWVLIEPFVTQVNFGQSNYGNEDINSISLTLRFDYGIHRLIG
jgi:hypothetical protein